MIRFSHAPQSAVALRLALPPLRRLRAPSRLPTLAAPSLWSRLLAVLEPAAARERRETRRAAVVLTLPRRFG
ncbi:MAG: hypothetical protein KF788_06590 [Piscinibacter sp.]|nr:hypothetical protein [Piscinibacter sp.]